MRQVIRLVIWDALFFLLLTIGTGISASLSGVFSYAFTVLMLSFCGAFLAALGRWGIGLREYLVVGLPALYLALIPVLRAFAATAGLVPDALNHMPVLYHYMGAVTAGFIRFKA